MTTNQLTYWRDRETARNNLAVEQETRRSNLAREAIQRGTLIENAKHNRASETETNRSNLANEDIKRRQNSVAIASLQETSRANRAREANDLLNIATNKQTAEMKARVDIAKANQDAKIRAYQHNETVRSNLVKENLQTWKTAFDGVASLISSGIKMAGSL